MEADINLFEFFASIGFVLVGTVVFQVSALISGYNIYKEKESNEANFISIAVGLIIFLLSPLSIIILYPIPNYKYIDIFFEIISFQAIIPFLISAIGFGLIFGYLSMLRLRRMVLIKIRDLLGIPFWIFDYAMEWDDFLTGVKREGNIIINAQNNKKYEGGFMAASVRNQPREIHLLMDNGKQILVLGDTIENIEVESKSFNRHMESSTHISQALNCVMVAIGIYLLSFSSQLMKDYLISKDYLENALINYSDIINYYLSLKYIFIAMYILVLVIALFLAKKDFNHLESYIYFCPDFLFVLIFGIIIAFISMDISSYPFLTSSSLSNYDLRIMALSIFILYTLLIRRLMKNKINNKFKSIIMNIVLGESDKIKVYNKLNEIFKYMYLNLDFNGSEVSKFETIKSEIIDKFPDDKSLIEKLFSQIVDLKKKDKYLVEEDINILWCLKNKVLADLLKKDKKYSPENFI
jgi:hypothetical protein